MLTRNYSRWRSLLSFGWYGLIKSPTKFTFNLDASRWRDANNCSSTVFFIYKRSHKYTCVIIVRLSSFDCPYIARPISETIPNRFVNYLLIISQVCPIIQVNSELFLYAFNYNCINNNSSPTYFNTRQRTKSSIVNSEIYLMHA